MEKCVYKHLNYDGSVFDYSDKRWDAHFAAVETDKNACVASKLLAMYRRQSEEVQKTYGAKNCILGQLNLMFIAGIDTSIHTTEYALVLLAKYPAAQQRIYKEISAVFGGSDGWQMENVVFWTVVSKLHCLRAFASHRLRPSACHAQTPKVPFL